MCSLVTAVVGEAHKRELIPHKGFGDGEGLLLSPVFLEIIKITCINVTAQLRNHRGSRYTHIHIQNTKRERNKTLQKGMDHRDSSCSGSGEAVHSLSRMLSQAHWSFLKKACRFISSTPLRPNRTSLERADTARSNGFNQSETAVPLRHGGFKKTTTAFVWLSVFPHTVIHTNVLDYEAITGSPDRTNAPVSEEGADEALGIFRDVAVIREGQSVFMVHDLAIGSHQRVGVKRCVP